jgi:hypothetical protein
MQDVQVPTEAEDGASDPPRRSSLRLSDAEAVATVRRDMFGDGSLLDAMGGAPEAAPGAENPSASPAPAADPAAPVQAGEPPSPEGETAEGHAGAPAVPGPFATVGQPLDAIIDSFPAEPVAGAPQSGQEVVESGLAAGVPCASPVPLSPVPLDAGAAASEPLSSPVPATETPQMGISSLFDSLGSIELRVGLRRPVEEPPPPLAPPQELDMSMLEVQPVGPLPQAEREPPTAASLAGGLSAPAGQEPSADEAEAGEIDAGRAEAGDAPADEVEAGRPDLDMSMLERPAARPVLQPEGDPHGADPHYGEPTAPAHGGLEAHGMQAGELGTGAEQVEPALGGSTDMPAEYDAPGPGGGEPAFASDAAGYAPFAAPAALPPFPEHSDAATMPGLAEDPLAGGAPTFIEPLVRAVAEPSEPAYAQLSHAQLSDEHSFGGPIETEDARGFPEPPLMPGYGEPPEAAARPMFDAAAKIAAEAQATAEALGNLERLVAYSAPGVQEPVEPARSPASPRVRLNLHGDPTPFPPSGPAALMPLPLPVPPDRNRIKGIYVVGFLTGLGLSLMAGVVLYVLINMV